MPGDDGATEVGKRRWNWVWYRPTSDENLSALMLDRNGMQRSTSLPPGTTKDEDIVELRSAAGSTAKAAANAVALAHALSTGGNHLQSALSGWELRQRRLGISMSELGISLGDRIMQLRR